MQLQAQLRVGATLLLAVAAGISGYVFQGYANAYRQSTRDLQTLASYNLVLKAGNAMSAERSPSNILLSLDQDAGPVYASTAIQMADARHRTDDALDQLEHMLAAQPPASPDRDKLSRARKSLAKGRTAIDQLLQHAPATRSSQDLQDAINKMVLARKQLDPLIGDFFADTVQDAPDQARIMQMARILSDLREYGGRIDSMLLVPLSASEPIDPSRHLVIDLLRGHIDELHRLLPERLDPSDRRAGSIDSMRAQVEHDFFGHTLPLIDSLMARSGSDYGMSAAAFTSQTMPDLMALEKLEDQFIQRAIDQLAQVKNDNRRHMLMIGAYLLAFYLFLLVVLRAAQSFVIRPLLLARQEIINLAHGDLRPAPRAGNSAEVRALHEAIDTLRRHHLNSMQLAIERDELSKALRRQAHTDALTGLLNRHALEEITGDLSAEPVRLSKDRGLILIDVDYFKPINDEHGHIVGDLVLREVASRIMRSVAAPHMAFRYGGEEFAILTTGLSMKALCLLAEDVRHAIAGDEFTVHNSLRLGVTASFGVAKGDALIFTWLDLLNAADTALYRAKAQGRNQLVSAPRVSDVQYSG
ncbi:diguanylate cyclase [Dyella flava]|uniref:diguanylate cyclase n=1 Tax=Dyella flava TaxID=1920170 RepID=A0ABS2K0V6_9GAMM|nr:GGDEF domain-containing protein [Dyella flava]MBM7124240.1 GGDEF domain-containing protein [Dyella flava]GLQ50483.1 GGDEF domain-containing protein [Dyella flava]